MSAIGRVTDGASGWAGRYGGKHRWVRLTAFPPGITPPRKVRVYRRADTHYVLNWWDPAAKKNLSERIDGDLLAALARARQVDERIVAVRTAGVGAAPRVGHADLVDRFLADLARRADAGEVDPKTVARYRAALDHYLAYCASPEGAKRYPAVVRTDRDFRLGLAAFLATRTVSGNGRGGAGRPMRGQRYVLDTVRAAFAWAADPDRGGLLPDGFRNPFRGAGGKGPVLVGDPLAAPDITLGMAVDLVRACDRFQLKLFVPPLLCGLRAAEPCHLLRADLSADWLAVPCRPELGVWTKGRRDKRFPLVPGLASFWRLFAADPGPLLYTRRGHTPGRAAAIGADDLVRDYRTRCDGVTTARERSRVRDRLFREYGALTYDHVEAEFRGLADMLGWRRAATLKDLRHLFATGLNNAGVPEGYRRYLLGHAPGTAAVVAYTHLDDLRRHYERAMTGEFADLLAAVSQRVRDLEVRGPLVTTTGRTG